MWCPICGADEPNGAYCKTCRDILDGYSHYLEEYDQEYLGELYEMYDLETAGHIEKPYLEEEVTVTIRRYNPNYGDSTICECGHPYYRHFDSYDGMNPCCCKYCICYEFRARA